MCISQYIEQLELYNIYSYYDTQMIYKTAQFEQAVQLRKRGFTLNEIAKIVDVSKSTVSLWLSRETWSKSITESNQKRASKDNRKRILLLNKARGNQYRKLYTEAERSAVTEFKHYKHNPLFIAGLMLYVSEGDSSDNHLIRITSSRFDIHRIFIKFVLEYLGVPKEKIRFWLLLYHDLDEERCMKVWSRKLGLSIVQFHKNQVIQSRSKKETLHYGVGNTIIGGTVLKKKLLKWIQVASKEL